MTRFPYIYPEGDSVDQVEDEFRLSGNNLLAESGQHVHRSGLERNRHDEKGGQPGLLPPFVIFHSNADECERIVLFPRTKPSTEPPSVQTC